MYCYYVILHCYIIIAIIRNFVAHRTHTTCKNNIKQDIKFSINYNIYIYIYIYILLLLLLYYHYDIQLTIIQL